VIDLCVIKQQVGVNDQKAILEDSVLEFLEMMSMIS
jgi:hypothetical protein